MADWLPPPPPSTSDEAQQYTHSGGRYLLGFGHGFFGIWDRSAGSALVERFPRTVEGWQAAWRRYVALEPAHTEVGLGASPVPSAAAVDPAGAHPASSTTSTSRPGVGSPAHPAWWLLPILMGWMGGLMAWLLIRDQDPRRARAMLVTGIVATVVWLVVYSTIVPVRPST